MDKVKCQRILPGKDKMQLKNVKLNKPTETVDFSKNCRSKSNEHAVESNQFCENKEIQGAHSVNLTTPDILSALQLANAIQVVSSEKRNLHDDKPEPPNLLKGLKNANIPFTKQVYKNLVELEVNDDDLMSGKRTSSKRNNLNKHFDDNFQLLEHFKPDFSAQFYTEPEVEEVEHTKIEYYNGYDIYNLLQSLPDVV